jgi:hypothetical protein
MDKGQKLCRVIKVPLFLSNNLADNLCDWGVAAISGFVL